jgi:membrane-associated phospholipid phosphatase
MNIIITNLFEWVGRFGPVILIFLSMFLLWNKNNLFFFYTVGLFIDAILNIVLKGIIKHPRPCEEPKAFNLALTHGRRFLFKDGIPYDIFGMPSGHSQSSLFSTMFIYLSLKNTKITLIYLFISLITMAQRVVFNQHTIIQCIVGGIVGSAFAFIMFHLSGQKMKGMLTEKRDDYGPI